MYRAPRFANPLKIKNSNRCPHVKIKCNHLTRYLDELDIMIVNFFRRTRGASGPQAKKNVSAKLAN